MQEKKKCRHNGREEGKSKKAVCVRRQKSICLPLSQNRHRNVLGEGDAQVRTAAGLHSRKAWEKAGGQCGNLPEGLYVLQTMERGYGRRM